MQPPHSTHCWPISEPSEVNAPSDIAGKDDFGVAPVVIAKLRRTFERTPGLMRVWIFGSRARGDHRQESDIDLAVDAPDLNAQAFSRLNAAIEDLGLIYRVDVVRLQDDLDPAFRENIERDRRQFWAPQTYIAGIEEIGSTELKPFQRDALAQFARYLDELGNHRDQAERAAAALRAADVEVPAELSDYPKKAWDSLRTQGRLPPSFADRPHSSRFDGAQRPVPNVCLKIPTGGGKTLLAAASVAQVFSRHLRRHTGLVLWVVPNDAIYRQTLKTLSDRDHPYRQMLNTAGAGRVKILEKNSPLNRLDIDSHLCVMVLMLQSAARQSKETLRFFRDRGNVHGFFPREGDYPAHVALLREIPNLDVYAVHGQSDAEARASYGAQIKDSLGNVMRLVRPMVVIDEGHHAYTDNALATIDGFNPCFMLELSATPRVSAVKASGSNILVDARGTDLDAAEMIKLPINVEVKPWQDWHSCLAAAAARLDQLQNTADELRADTARYIRPILLVQVERTGKDLRDAGFIHAEDARAYLIQLGLSEKQIAIKTSDKDELKQLENIELLSPNCEVRAIITKQALQEGWDCPFAYVLCALAAGRSPGAVTQLVGRILRQPQVTKTGRALLDECYVYCHDIRTADVVSAIKASLENEGMGDLAIAVRSGDGGPDSERKRLTRRAPFETLRVFLPRVSFVERSDGAMRRRELSYESDVLGRLDWSRIDVDALGAAWAPDATAPHGQRFRLGLEQLSDDAGLPATEILDSSGELQQSHIVRALLDLAPNPWQLWEWVGKVVARLIGEGFAEGVIARSSSSLIQALRGDLESERDRIADGLFTSMVSSGEIEFALRADATDFELPCVFDVELPKKSRWLIREDGQGVQKSLLSLGGGFPKALADNQFEAEFACYLDTQATVQWWHRNVAKAQYGLQGWRRHKVYPDFVIAVSPAGDKPRILVLETKGAHLSGNTDSNYKKSLLGRLTEAYRDRRLERVGELCLIGRDSQEIRCEMLLDNNWKGEVSRLML